MVEAGGIDPPQNESAEVTTSGQDRSHAGQVEPDLGQRSDVVQDRGLCEVPNVVGHGMTHPGQLRAPILPPQDSTGIEFVQMAWNRLPRHVQEGILTIRPRLSRPGKATGTTMSASRRQVAEQKHPGGASQLLVPVL